MATIMIIHPEGNLCNNPNLRGLVEILCQHGYQVDIFSQKHDFNQISPFRGCSIYAIDCHGKSQDTVLLHDTVENPVEHYANLVNYHLKKYDLVIGIDRGIIEASIIAKIQSAVLGLISYEIYFAHETPPGFKEAEIEACRNISFAVCQDKVRATLLSSENLIPLEDIIFMPVSGRTVGTFERQWHIHEALELPRDTKIALYMGEISGAWAGSWSIIESMAQAKDWALVLHHRYNAHRIHQLYSRIAENNITNVFLSPFFTLPAEDLHRLVCSADLGIAVYLPVSGEMLADDNLRYVGMASGKISTYMKFGLPVLMNEIGEMSHYVRNYSLGAVEEHIERFGARMQKLERTQLDFMGDNCLQFYQSHLSLDTTIQPLLCKLDELLNKTSNYLSLDSIEEVMMDAEKLRKPVQPVIGDVEIEVRQSGRFLQYSVNGKDIYWPAERSEQELRKREYQDRDSIPVGFELTKSAWVVDANPGAGFLALQVLNLGAKIIVIDPDPALCSSLARTLEEYIGKGQALVLWGMLGSSYSLNDLTPTYSLDSLLQLGLISRVNMVRIVESKHEQVLGGAEHVLALYKPCFSIMLDRSRGKEARHSLAGVNSNYLFYAGGSSQQRESSDYLYAI